MTASILAVLLSFGGLFGGGDGDCRIADEQAVNTMRLIGEKWPLRAIEDPVADYVQWLGVRLARGVDPQSSQPWDFYVLRNVEPSAIAVGGGHFVISDGLIAFVRNESELAAVLAHEISHQSLGHFCRGVSPDVKRIDRGTVVQHYELDLEMDADRDALELLSRAGFDTGAMASVLRCLNGSRSTSESHLRRRVQTLGGHWASPSRGGDSNSTAFKQVRRSVLKDLGDSARVDCR